MKEWQKRTLAHYAGKAGTKQENGYICSSNYTQICAHLFSQTKKVT